MGRVPHLRLLLAATWLLSACAGSGSGAPGASPTAIATTAPSQVASATAEPLIPRSLTTTPTAAPSAPVSTATRVPLTSTPTANATPTTNGGPTATPTAAARGGTTPRSTPGAVIEPGQFEPLPLREHPAVAAAIREVLGDSSSRFGVVIKRLADGQGAALAPDRSFYAASLFKLEVLYELYYQRERGLVSFNEALQVTERHLEYDLNTLRWPVGSYVPIPELASAMITYSDNAAAIMLADRLGGWNINQRLKALGMTQTEYSTELPTSARDMALLLEMIGRGEAVSPTASREMLALLEAQQVRDRIPALLPPGTTVAHKTGNWDNACHDAGIVYAPSGPFVIAVLSDMPGCAGLTSELAREVYDIFERGSSGTGFSPTPTPARTTPALGASPSVTATAVATATSVVTSTPATSGASSSGAATPAATAVSSPGAGATSTAAATPLAASPASTSGNR